MSDIRELIDRVLALDAAEHGKWETHGTAVLITGADGFGEGDWLVCRAQRPDLAEIIAEYRTAAPRLARELQAIAEVERLQVEALEAEVGRLRAQLNGSGGPNLRPAGLPLVEPEPGIDVETAIREARQLQPCVLAFGALFARVDDHTPDAEILATLGYGGECETCRGRGVKRAVVGRTPLETPCGDCGGTGRHGATASSQAVALRTARAELRDARATIQRERARLDWLAQQCRLDPATDYWPALAHTLDAHRGGERPE